MTAVLREEARRIGVVLSAALSHWRRRPTQAAMLIIGLAAATALFSGVQAINLQARASYAAAAGQLGGAQYASLVRTDDAPIGEDVFVALRRAGWPVSPVVEGRLRAGGRVFDVVGVDIATLPRGAGAFEIGEIDGAATPADFFLPPSRAIVARETLEALMRDGDQPQTDDGRALPPLIEGRGLAPRTILTDIAAAQTLLDAEGEITRFILGRVDESRTPPLDMSAGAPLERIEPGDRVDMARMTDSFHLNLTAFGLLSFFVGLLIVRSAVGLAFEQRLGVFRTLRAVGVSTRALVGALTLELIAIAAVAGGLGVALGLIIAAALLPGVAFTLRSLYGAPVAGELAVEPAWIALALAVSIIGALAASASYLVRARGLSALAPAQPEAWRAAARRGHVRGLAIAALMFAAALLALSARGGLIAGFAVMGATLLGAALALPSALALLLRLLEAPFQSRSGRAAAVARWSLADARQQLPSLALALQALLIALAVNIGVGAMVGSFRETFVGWLDQRLVAELYVNGGDPARAEEIRAAVEARPGVDATLPLIFREARRGAAGPVQVFGVADHDTYSEHWPLLARGDAPWAEIAVGRGALVNEQMARAEGLRVGATLTLSTPRGDWSPTIVGVYSDYGNTRPQIMVNVDALRVHWPSAKPQLFLVRARDDAVDGLETWLKTTYDLGETGLINQRDLKVVSKSIFEQTFAVTAALNVLTLIVAGVALLTGLVALSTARLPQLAPLWAMGLTRGALARLDLAKTLALALLTAFLAAPLGLVVAYLLTAVINVEAFGWRLPLFHYPGQWAGLGVLALVVAGLAALPSVVALARTPPARLLRVFADER